MSRFGIGPEITISFKENRVIKPEVGELSKDTSSDEHVDEVELDFIYLLLLRFFLGHDHCEKISLAWESKELL